jgi:death-on-curing family protein
MRRITTKEVREVAHALARELMKWDEPIPDFDTRRPGILEACIAEPFQTYDGKQLHRGTTRKLTVLFYLMIKDHPFQNGNKRIAMTTLFYALHREGYWMHISNEKFYRFAKWVAASDPQLREEIMATIEEFLRKNVVRRSQ